MPFFSAIIIDYNRLFYDHTKTHYDVIVITSHLEKN